MGFQYAEFDGATGYITVLNNAALNLGTGDFSICFWCKDIANTGAMLSKIAGPIEGEGTYLIYPESDGRIYLYTANPFDHYASFEISNLIGWNHIVFTKQGAIVKAWLNGISKNVVGDADTNSLSNTTNLQIGANGGNFMSGSLDDLRIYKKALSEVEVTTIYNNSVGTKYTGTDAAAVFSFDDGSADDVVGGLSTVITGGVSFIDGGAPFHGIALGNNYAPYRKFLNLTAKRIQFRLGGNFTLRSFGLFNIQPEDTR